MTKARGCVGAWGVTDRSWDWSGYAGMTAARVSDCRGERLFCGKPHLCAKPPTIPVCRDIEYSPTCQNGGSGRRVVDAAAPTLRSDRHVALSGSAAWSLDGSSVAERRPSPGNMQGCASESCCCDRYRLYPQSSPGQKDRANNQRIRQIHHVEHETQHPGRQGLGRDRRSP